MKSLIKIGLITSLISATAMAESGFLFGFEGNYNFKSQTDFKYSNTTSKVKFDDKKYGLIGLKLGYDFGLVRTYAGYYFICKKIDAKIETDGHGDLSFKHKKYILGIDFTPSITDNIKLVVGGYGGLEQMTYKANGKFSGGYISEKSNLNSTVVGGKVGSIVSSAIFNPNLNNAELEFGIKGDYAKFSKYEAKHSSVGAYVALNIKF